MTIEIMNINEALNKTKDLVQEVWNNNATIGHNLYLIKESFNGNTKEFGSYLQSHCPKLDVKMVSYYIKLAGYNKDQYSKDTIIDWLTSNAINATNPRSCWDKFNKAHKTEALADEKNGEVEQTTTQTKDSLVARLAQIYDEFQKRAVEFDENELDTVATIAQQFTEFIDTIV